MAASIKFFPGSTIRWHGRQNVIVDYDLDGILGREFDKRKLERIPIAEAQSDETASGRAPRTVDLVAVPEDSWRTAVEKFKALRPLLEMSEAKRTRVEEAAQGRYRLRGRSEHSYCSQGRRSIRFAKEDRPEESHRLHKRLRPLADHSQLRGIPCRQFSGLDEQTESSRK
jgi:hypothetical protein